MRYIIKPKKPKHLIRLKILLDEDTRIKHAYINSEDAYLLVLPCFDDEKENRRLLKAICRNNRIKTEEFKTE